MTRWRVRALAVFGVLAFATVQPLPVAAQTNLEFAVKANYLVRFAAFVDWPPGAFAQPNSPLVICVAGRNPFGTALVRAATGQTAHGRPLRVRVNVTEATSAACHILYLSGGADPALVAAPPRSGLLMVSDAAVSPKAGTIHFVVDAARVRFHIDAARAQRSRLSISSRLLALALTVTGT